MCHSTNSERDKITFQRCVQHAKDAFKALGVSTALIDAVGSLKESDFPTNEVRKLEKGIKEETSANIKFLEGMSSDIKDIKQTVDEGTAKKEHIAMFGEKINELKAAQDERDEKNTHEYTRILEGVSSDIDVLKQMVKGNTADKEDINKLEKKINELKVAQDECDDKNTHEYTKIIKCVSSDMEVLKQKVKGAADKEDIAKLEQKINELKMAQNERDAQVKNSGCVQSTRVSSSRFLIILTTLWKISPCKRRKMFPRPRFALLICLVVNISICAGKPQDSSTESLTSVHKAKPLTGQSVVVNNNCGLAKPEREMMAHIKDKVDYIAAQFGNGSPCSDGWVLYGNSCYLVIDIPTLEWNAARRNCQKLGGDLAKITTFAENQFIFNLLLKQTKVKKYGAWLGLHRKADTKFYWADGTPLTGYTAWNAGEPSSPGEKCGHIHALGSGQGKWNDWSCSVDQSVIMNAPVVLCEKKSN